MSGQVWLGHLLVANRAVPSDEMWLGGWLTMVSERGHVLSNIPLLVLTRIGMFEKICLGC